MANNFRQVGVHGKNLPAKKNLRVLQAQFSIGGMIGKTDRQYNKTYPVKSVEEMAEIFGGQITSGNYLWDTVSGFFANTQGLDATLYIQSYVGYDIGGDVIDAVVANRDKADVGADADAYVVQPAYLDELQYGAGGNRIGTKFIQAERVTTQAAATVAATAVSIASLDSVQGMVVGDLILFKTAAGVSPVYKIITAIDETANTVSWAGDFEASGGSGETLSIDDDVVISGFRVQTYVKSPSGIETEVDTDLGKIICSSESLVVDFFVDNVFKNSKYIKVTEGSASTLGDRLPVTDSAIVYNTSGADGTAINSVEAVNAFLPNFNNLPIRMLANPETTDTAQQKALITYSLGRENDNPIVLVNIAEDQTKAQLTTIGASYQKSTFQPAIITANWLEVTDPFSSSVIAPLRTIPNVGHVMGAWINSIQNNGIHWVPATAKTIINGALDVDGDQFLDDDDRTDLINSGINVIQNRAGVGIKIGNWVTISTETEYQFGNGIIMRNFIKVSTIDSLQPAENTPNTLPRIRDTRNVIISFMRRLWNSGSNGNVNLGETFAQEELTINGVKTLTKFEDHVEVQADNINNPNSELQIGNQNYQTYFSFPGPAQSIRTGVGLLIRA
jgi:hypothetical protein